MISGCWYVVPRSQSELFASEGKLFCGDDATEWRPPDGRVGTYCALHGPEVVALVEKRLRDD